MKALYEEFQRGFYKVCDKDIIEFFHPEELKDVIIGNTDYDWETFEKVYHKGLEVWIWISFLFPEYGFFCVFYFSRMHIMKKDMIIHIPP